jgi:inorganic pyrophosphatase
MTDYTPIACSRYDDFELAIMHREWLRLGLDANDADLRELVVLPLDIGVADGAEWLTGRDEQGLTHRLRLDRIAILGPAASPPDPRSDRLPAPLSVTVEIPRGSFRKVGSTGSLDFLSPLPCPFNYGSVRTRIGLEGDLLDAVVLGPRVPAGTVVQAFAQGAVGLYDRGLYDDKLICSPTDLDPRGLRRTRRVVVAFFAVYGVAKRLLNIWRGRPGRTRSAGWVSAEDAWGRSKPNNGFIGPSVPF